MKKLFFSALLLGLGTGATFAQETNQNSGKSKPDESASVSPKEITDAKSKKSSEAGISPRVKKEDEQSATHHQKATGQRRSPGIHRY
ncbi:hypothetical protein GNY06_02775 [Elizabethkingia argentiflava]|uniref:Uncharacterized protein n=1 Tax=Elizabethkingia argenteiflava TaxID=2681556 RepID=A0A845PV50_9FLAO|nr:hypothetical protein [Elizabethkingia argenteiflava]NAW50357.1 hypothetical protein [Elizabethkingia argenteiflava]